MREHTRLQQLLSVYDDLSGEERQRIERHLQDCQECAATLAAYRAMDRGVHGLVQAKLSDMATKPALQRTFLEAPSFEEGGRPPKFGMHSPARSASGLVERVRQTVFLRSYGMRLAGAVVFLLLLMILSALFGGWGPFDQPVLASTPTVEQQRVATAPASFDVHATPIAWAGTASGPADGQTLAPAHALPKPPVALAVAATPPGMALFDKHVVNKK